MLSFLDNVDGCVLHMKKLHTTVSFPTESDALFASFFTNYATTSLTIFDDFLSLLRHPKFNVEELATNNSSELMDHISKQRQIFAERRVCTSRIADTSVARTTNSTCVPTLIVEFLAEYIASERTPFHLAISEFSDSQECEADIALRNMALVHRSWTAVAQHTLYRRIIVHGTRNMRFILQSPQLGPWVRELSVCGNSHDCPTNDKRDIVRMTCDILKRCSNVQTLVLDDMRLECDVGNWPGPCSTFHQLGNLTRLKDLRLHFIDGPPGNLWNLCQVLPQLQALTRLSLCNWYIDEGTVDVQQIQTSLEATQPSLALQAVSLIHVLDTELDAFAWLLRSCKGPRPQMRLELSADDIFRSSGSPDMSSMNLLPAIEDSNPYIAQLNISNVAETDNIGHIVRLLPTLQTLCISLNCSWPPYFELPQSVHSLQLHFFYIPREDGSVALLRLLDASPALENLLVTYDPDFETIQEDFFQFLTELCANKNIHFRLSHLKYWPTIFDT